MDETWHHHFTPESNRQSTEWTARYEPTPKCGKTQKSAGKVMASVFWDTHDITFIDYLKKGKYKQRLLRSVIGAFKRRNRGKAASFEEKESAVSSKQCTVSQINEIDDKIA
ncbi:transposase [Trichonephila clavipes]|nr:transposase [Trichonephila clavipes]